MSFDGHMHGMAQDSGAMLRTTLLRIVPGEMKLHSEHNLCKAEMEREVNAD